MATRTIACISACAAAVALLAAGCGNSSNSSSSTTSSSAPAPAETTASQMSGGSMSAAAPIPASLHCTDAIVWANVSKKTYHMSGDPYYGRTKHGEYMCEGMAESKGYHLAGTPHNHTGSQMNGATATPSPAST